MRTLTGIGIINKQIETITSKSLFFTRSPLWTKTKFLSKAYQVTLLINSAIKIKSSGMLAKGILVNAKSIDRNRFAYRYILSLNNLR
ncbi:hypothetical protein H7F33_11900 [Pedobacter sp. PAMC26386]|nr:hypothetical protein H7F33_11900 [Pedobacter sp. PAMC26386]